MPPSGKMDSTRSELIRNGTLVNLPHRRLLERMKPQARQEVRYALHTSCMGMNLNIDVLASGVMSLEARLPYAVVENGQMTMSSEPEQVLWSDTGEMAMIPTRLGRRHLMEDVTVEMVVDAFLSAFGTHTNATGDVDYSYWSRAMDLYAGVIAAENGMEVEIIHHLPLMSPYLIDPGGKSPLIGESTSHIYTIDNDMPEEQIQYRVPVMKIQKQFQPEAMELVLHLPTTVVRRQHCAVFQASPDGRSKADHISDFTAHMRSATELRRTA